MEDNGGSNVLAFFILIVVFVAAAGLGGLLLMDSISENQTETAKQTTLQEQARTQATIVQEREETERVREREQWHTERWQSFLVAMNSNRDLLPFAILAASVWLFLGYMIWSDRRR